MSTKDSTLTQEYLQSVFLYSNGNLYWIKSHNKKIKIGKKAGTLTKSGYINICINKKFYRAHRLIFLHQNGFLPNFIDHIDCNKSNNKIENLREATKSQNQCNRAITTLNKSGVKNVSWSKDRKEWAVQISIKGKKKFIGRYKDLELADLVATEARDKYHGKFARHK